MFVKKICKNFKAFSLTEVMIALAIMGVLLAVVMQVSKTRIDSTIKFYTYAALLNTQKAVASLIAEGYNDPDDGFETILATLPPVAHHADGISGFCDRFSNITNTIGTTSAINCTRTTTSGFSAANTNFILTNGMRYYNFGANPDVSGNYNIYVDVDGPRGKSLLNTDVLKFLVNQQTGRVVPASDSSAANNTKYLSCAVRYGQGTSLTTVKSAITYREAFCISGNASDVQYSSYCSGYSTAAACASNKCEMVVSTPTAPFMMFKIPRL